MSSYFVATPTGSIALVGKNIVDRSAVRAIARQAALVIKSALENDQSAAAHHLLGPIDPFLRDDREEALTMRASSFLDTIERVNASGDEILSYEEGEAWLRAFTCAAVVLSRRSVRYLEDDDEDEPKSKAMVRHYINALVVLQQELVEALNAVDADADIID